MASGAGIPPDSVVSGGRTDRHRRIRYRGSEGMRRADRLFAIIQLMRRNKLTRARDLARKLEVSERTVYRDIQDLVASGVPIEGERSEEHTSELQSLMRISYAVFCLKKKKKQLRQQTDKDENRDT